MAVGKFEDHEWKGVLIGVCLLYTVHMIITESLGGSKYPRIKGLAMLAAVEDISPSPHYGFWMVGNASYFAPGIMNRTDLNASSPTFLSWTPPPQWRDHCIASSGMPLNACSYFQYVEFPGFMTFFYIMMYVLEVAMHLTHIYAGIVVVYLVFRLVVRAMKNEGGIWTIMMPWGCMKSPDLSAPKFFTMVFMLYVFNVAWPSLMIYTVALIQPGFGLASSMHTGMLYFGALLNYSPLAMRCASLLTSLHDHQTPCLRSCWRVRRPESVPVDNPFSMIRGVNTDSIYSDNTVLLVWSDAGGADFIGPVTGGFLSIRIFAEPAFMCLSIVMYKANTVLLSDIAIKNAVKYGLPNRLLTLPVYGPTNIYDVKEWFKVLSRTAIFGNLQFWVGLTCFLTVHNLLSEFNIADPDFLRAGDDGRLLWMHFQSVTAFLWLVALIVFDLMLHCTLNTMTKYHKKSKHLLSEEVYKKRTKRLFEQKAWVWILAFATIHLSLMCVVTNRSPYQFYALWRPTHRPTYQKSHTLRMCAVLVQDALWDGHASLWRYVVAITTQCSLQFARSADEHACQPHPHARGKGRILYRIFETVAVGHRWSSSVRGRVAWSSRVKQDT